MARKSEFRDLFPDALELMIVRTLDRANPGSCELWIVRTLDRKPRHGYALARLRAHVEDRPECEIGLSASKSTARVFKRTEACRKQLEKELSSFTKMFAGINRVFRVAQP